STAERFSDGADEAAIRQLLAGAIRAGRHVGDVYPTLTTHRCVDAYMTLNQEGKATYLKILGREFGVSQEEVAARAAQYVEAVAKHGTASQLTEKHLRDALVPHYNQFFTAISRLPEGMPALLRMRADLLKILAEDGNDPDLRAVDSGLKSLLQEWFGMNSVKLERITWNTPAAVLEKASIMRYEAVHAVASWDELKQRLGPGRLCYAFFHKDMPTEPLTFIHVALMNEVGSNVQDILRDRSPPSDPKYFRAAIFYSISSAQRGLSGIDLGN
ncbi:hypothetical protein HK405_000425, partial [Cladochytrium tenue]